jgi:hypothetical protein
VVSLPDQPTTVVPTQFTPPPTPEPEDRGAGAHRAPDPDPEPGSVIPPAAPITPSYEAPSYEAPSTPSYETPSYETPSYEAPSTPSYEPPPGFAGPPGPPFGADGPDGSSGAPNNRNLIIGFLSAVGVLVVVLVLAAVYGFVIRDNTETQVAAPGASTSSSKTTTSSEPSGTGTASPTPGLGGEATQGDFVFSVASTDRGDTVTSPIDDSVVNTATGEYFVVYLNVGNNGSAPLTFLSVLQLLSDGTQTYPPDIDASVSLSGGQVTIDPGEQLETALAFDVPVGTTATSIQLHGLPGDPGVDLPL